MEGNLTLHIENPQLCIRSIVTYIHLNKFVTRTDPPFHLQVSAILASVAVKVKKTNRANRRVSFQDGSNIVGVLFQQSFPETKTNF